MTAPRRPSVWTSSPHSAATGAGMVQHAVAAGLVERGYDVTSERHPAAFDRAVVPRLKGLAAENLSAARHRGAIGLIMATPAPILPPRTSILVVYDLRWMSTRGRVSRWYRGVDLALSGRRATSVCTALDPVADRLADRLGRHVDVIPFGPGRAEGWTFQDDGNGDLVLMGRAAHKSNEIAAAGLVTNNSWFERVVTVNVSDETRALLDAGLQVERVEHHGYVSDDELRSILEASSTYMHLGTNEGFGFPYLEALAAGCQVVARRYDVTEHLLGDAAVLIDDPSDRWFEQMGRSQHRLPAASVRRDTLARYSWDACCDAFAALIDRLADER